MFSASLIAAMYQSLDDGRESATPLETTHTNFFSVAMQMRDLLRRFPDEKSTLPIVGYSKLLSGENTWFPEINTDSFDDEPLRFFWGRVPLTELIEYLAEFHGRSAEEELFDLGTPLRENATGSSFDATCANLLAKTATASTTSRIAMVDSGESKFGDVPNDYNGKLRHAITQDVILSDHAEKILSVMLERLDGYGVLAETEVSCALVKKPVKPIGRACFRHANAVEMLDALKALRAVISNDTIPTAINMSLGTHVGPHNGDSPLEAYATRIGNLRANRFFHASAGNDGLSGVAAVRSVTANQREFFQISVNQGCTDILVEFWWHDPKPSSVSLEATVLAGDSQRPLTKLWIDSKTAGRTLKSAPQGFGRTLVKSLFHSQCRNDMSCIAFALSAPNASPLTPVDVQFAIDASDDIVVNGWIVVCGGARAMFVEGGSSATITVPASAPGILSVAGLDNQGRPWAQSSRGPAIVYDRSPGQRAPTAPSMAHRADWHGEYGTSFASARACGDTVNVVQDPQRLRNCGTILDLICESYQLARTQPQAWSVRTGYIAVKN